MVLENDGLPATRSVDLVDVAAKEIPVIPTLFDELNNKSICCICDQTAGGTTMISGAGQT
jgi:hypothetical protein